MLNALWTVLQFSHVHGFIWFRAQNLFTSLQNSAIDGQCSPEMEEEVSKGHSPETTPWPSTADTQRCCSSVCWLVEGSVCTSTPPPARSARGRPPRHTPRFSPESLLHTTPSTTSTGSAPTCTNITQGIFGRWVVTYCYEICYNVKAATRRSLFQQKHFLFCNFK